MRTYSRAVLMFWLFAAPALAGGNQGNSALEGHRLVAFNDLGMHCMDREFSVFAILPPFNVVNAQVIRQGVHGNPVILDSSAVELRYLPVADRTGSINSTSRLKTDFWQYAYELFGATLRPGQGLLGFYMPKDRPTTVPQLMNYHASYRWFSAEGVPITPIDDAGQVNTYPLMRIAAFDRLTGTELAQLDVVVPVAQETDCKNCHATGEIAARDPAIGWSNDPDIEIQSKENVLILHDWNQWTNLRGSTPVLCASCHYSPALDLAGAGPQGDQVGRPLMSHVAHNFHGKLRDDAGQPLFPPDGDAEQTCYQCHPGKVTKCERGAMKNGNLECKDCHGGMLSVGAEHLLLPGGSMDGQNDGGRRRPWLDLPRCQSCHTGDVLSHLSGPQYVPSPDGIRLRQAFLVGDDSASPILAANKRFAENLDTRYRFSFGHGGVACEGCHNSTHAEWPNADPLANDNVAALQLQRHTGPLIECTVCHLRGSLGLGMNGPHGLHNVNEQRWVDDHGDFWERNPDSCKTCHGLALEGTVLARAAADRTFQIEHGSVRIPKGQPISCTLCHEKPH